MNFGGFIPLQQNMKKERKFITQETRSPCCDARLATQNHNDCMQRSLRRVQAKPAESACRVRHIPSHLI